MRDEFLNINNIIVRVRLTKNNPKVMIILLHGMTGNENSMSVFSNQLDQNAAMFSPRAPYSINYSEKAGFSWTPNIQQWPTITDFAESTLLLENLINELETLYFPVRIPVDLIGFSQGAALASAYVLRYPNRIRRLAMLSGFLPRETKEVTIGREMDLDVFIGHGALDDLVPLEHAYRAKQFLENSGARVRICVSEVGHKLGADCFHALKSFMSENYKTQ